MDTYGENPLDVVLKRLDEILKRQIKLERDVENVYKGTEGLMWLMTQITPRLPLPPMRAWGISPDFASVLAGHIQRYQPQVILELGGGISTLVAGYVLESLQSESYTGKVISVDHSAEFSMITRRNVQQHGLSQWVEFIHAPLTLTEIHNEVWEWYTRDTFDVLPPQLAFDLLVVDGPVQQDNPRRMVRYPALPVLFDRLKHGAYILVDDANREDERLIVQRWLHEYADQLTLVEDYFTEKGTKLLQKR